MKNHLLIMLVVCGFMLLGFVWLAGGESNWAWLMIIVCPLVHLFMGHADPHGQKHDSEQTDHNFENSGGDSIFRESESQYK